MSTSSGRGASLVAAGILASRAAGVVRELVVAAFLGTGPAVDAFTAAFRIPNLLQNLLGEGVLSASFIPTYSRLLAEGREADAAKVASTVLALLTALTGGLVVVGVLFADPIAGLIAGGFTEDRRALTATLVRIVTPGIGLLVLSAWCLGILNSHRRFFLSYVAPVVWNLAQIVALTLAGLFVYTEATDAGRTLTPDARSLTLLLGWSTLVGAALQLGIQVPAVRRLRGDLAPTLSIDPETRGVIQRFLPVVGARGVVQLSAFLDIFLGSFLVVGAVASLRFGSVLYLLPISVFGMSIAAAELPELSAAAADRRLALRERAQAMIPRLRSGMARIGYFVVPTAVLYLAAGDIVVGALLQRGAFDRAATLQVWTVLAAYAIGLIPATSARLLQSASYGLLDTRTPARASVIRIAVSTGIGVVLMLQLDRVGIGSEGIQMIGELPAFAPLDEATRADASTPRLGAAGLALGAAAGAWTELIVLRQRLRRAFGPLSLGGGALEITALGALAAAGITVPLRLLLGGLPPLLLAVLVLLPAGVVYLVTTRVLGFSLARAVSGRPPRPRHRTIDG